MQPNIQQLLKLKEQCNFDNLFRLIEANGDKIASEYYQDNEIRHISYRELCQASRKAACKIGMLLGAENRGRYVGVHLDNCPEWPHIFWGILLAGYCPILLDFRATHPILLHLLAESDALAIITAEKKIIQPGLRQYDKQEVTAWKGKIPDDWQAQWGRYVALCTSGTTSSSKVFVYDEVAIAKNLAYGWTTYEVTPYLMDSSAKVLAFIPFYHIFGLFAVKLWPSLCGTTVVYLQDRAPATLLETCQRHAITQVYGVPLLWNNAAAKLLAKVSQLPWHQRLTFRILCAVSLGMQWLAPAQGLKFAYRCLFRRLHQNFLGTTIQGVVSAGAYLSPKTLKLLTALGFPVISAYGMTESGVVSVEDGKSFMRRWHSSVGKPFPSVEIKIVPCAAKNSNGVGQLFLRSEFLHTGRLCRGKLVAPLRTEDGWLDTGDLAKERKGVLYLRGRSKDTIIKETGENIYPDELEAVFGSLADVEGICILGLSNDSKGEDTTLIIDCSERYRDPEVVTALSSQVYQINKTLPLAKRINRLLISHQPLPITTSMKTQRQKLKQLLEQKKWPHQDLPLTQARHSRQPARQQQPLQMEQEVLAGVRAIFAEVLARPQETIGDEDHFLEELGGDSLEAIALATALERKYRIFIPDAVLLECTNVKEITQAVLRQLSSSDGQSDNLKLVKTRSKRQPLSDFTKTREYKLLALQLQNAGEFNPYFVCHDSIVRDTSVISDQSVINFGSYNYLGLSGHPETIKAAQQAIARYGTSASGSRLLTGEKSLYRQLEQQIAQWKQVDDVLVLVSGHATNVSFIGHFANEHDLIVYDALSHNSIEQGCRLARADSKAFPHNDFLMLDSILQQTRDYYEKVLIIIEGVYSMDGDIAPLPEFVALKKRYGAFLMVDEAHSTCVIGETGKGIDEHFAMAPEDIDIRMGTLSKGLGSCGGYLAGNKHLIEYLRYTLPGFVFSVGISPANAAAALAAVKLVQKDQSLVKRLHQNIDTFLAEANKRHFHICLAERTAIIPILIGSDEAAFLLSTRLKQHGVFVPPAVYPAVPKGKARLRFCVTSEHQKQQIVLALDLLKELAASENIDLPAMKSQLASAC